MIYKRQNKNTNKNTNKNKKKFRQTQQLNKKTRHKRHKQHKHIKKRFNKPKSYTYKKHSYYLKNNGKFPYWIQP